MASQEPRPSPLKLSDVKSFDKGCLRKTETTITNADGSRVIEGKDEEGHSYRRKSKSSCPGFVLDTAEDLRVAEVRSGIILGSQDVAHNLDLLNQHGVTHILNVATGVDNLFQDQFIYQTQACLDLPEFPIVHGFESAINFIDKANEAKGCVLVHCNAGVSRSAAIVMAYLIKREGMTVNEALSYLRSKRSAVCPNSGFIVQLQNFYDSLHQHSDVKPTH